MVFKVYYQPTKKINPRRENTESLYLEADSEPEELSDAALEYEKESPAFKLTEF